MSSEWRTTPASEFCLSVRDGTHDSPKEVASGGKNLVTSRHIKGGLLDLSTSYKISEEDYEEINKRSKVDQWDTLFSMIGTVGEVLLVKDPPNFAIKNVGLFKSRSEVTGKWLYYYLQSPGAREEIYMSMRGSTQQYIPLGALRSFPICHPPSEGEMLGITTILGTLDDKIELNRKTNETLEAMAKALFKSWFVDFDPVRAKAEGRPTGLPAEISDLFPDSIEDSELGEIPSGWRVVEIEQILNLQKDAVDPNTAPDEEFDHYSIPAFDAGRYPAKDLGSDIKSQKFLVGDGDLLVSKLNPSIPRVWIPFPSSRGRAICSTEFLVCRAYMNVGRAFAYCLASSDAIIEAMTGLAGGTSNSHQRVRPNDFLALPCCIGTETIQSAFSSVVEPLLKKGLTLIFESKSLSITRDALLPKLISGEIRIPDAEKMLEEVGI